MKETNAEKKNHTNVLLNYHYSKILVQLKSMQILLRRCPIPNNTQTHRLLQGWDIDGRAERKVKKIYSQFRS